MENILNRRTLISFVCLFSVTACQVVPEESENRLLIIMSERATYIYDSVEYDAKPLSRKIRKDFMSGVIDTRKIEIHCLKNMKFSTMLDFSIFPEYGIKLISTKNYILKSECSSDEVDLTINA